MKIVLKNGRAGTNFAHDAGSEHDVDVEEAGRMLVTGQCSIPDDADRKAAKDAVGDWHQGLPWPPVKGVAAGAGQGKSGDDDDDDSDALNGNEEPAKTEAAKTALQKAKAKKAEPAKSETAKAECR